jgi:antitoxin component HigA of HigAB toxin-antitoxin module
MEENKDVVVDETPTAAEKEEKVLEDAGKSTSIEDGVYKVDLSKPPKQETDAVQEQSTDESVLRGSGTDEKTGEKADVGLQEVQQEESQLTLEEVIEEETKQEPEEKLQEDVKEEVTKEEVVAEAQTKPEIELPENIQKVVDFMNETGGTLEDYVKINQDYSNMDDSTLLYQYYNQTKPHLAKDEIDFLIEDNFSIDEEIDEPKDIKRKQLAYKEEIAKAKSYLEGLKGKYYEEVKLGSKLTSDQQKAIEFFNTYNSEQSEQQKLQEKQTAHFNNESSKVFNEDFKGFEFKVADKKYRFNVKDKQQVFDKQSNILNVLDKYIGKDNMLQDAAGYHKALFVADNADAIATHFYEQGKADAIKQLNAESKNINMDPRKASTVETAGIKVRAITGDDSSKLKIKLRQ